MKKSFVAVSKQLLKRCYLYPYEELWRTALDPFVKIPVRRRRKRRRKKVCALP